MNGQYLRVTPAELAKAIDVPEWALELAEKVQEAEEGADLPPVKARHLTTDQAWQAIAFLLERVHFPVNIVHGEEQFSECEDWGYGPPRYLPADRVQVAARSLAGLGFDDLVRGVDPAQLARANVYPQVWDEPDALAWVQGWYELLVSFFAAAAEDGQAILTWLD